LALFRIGEESPITGKNYLVIAFEIIAIKQNGLISDQPV